MDYLSILLLGVVLGYGFNLTTAKIILKISRCYDNLFKDYVKVLRELNQLKKLNKDKKA